MKGRLLSPMKDLLIIGLLAFVGAQLFSIRRELQGIRHEQLKNMYWVLPEHARAAIAAEQTGIAKRKLESTAYVEVEKSVSVNIENEPLSVEVRP
ncbi:MAG: hypothetical protein ACRD5G_08350 [Candidatus Acidiferrales bacterium]